MGITLPPSWKVLRPHAVQYALWRARERRLAVRAGRGSGKTTICLRKVVAKLPAKTWHGEPGKYAFVAPTREQAKRIAWEPLKALIVPEWRKCEPHETSLTITTIWGSSITVLGFDRPQRIEGVQWDGILSDESADTRPLSVNQSVLPALTTKKGFVWRLGVPKRGGIGGREFKSLFQGAGGYRCFEWSAETILDGEEIDLLKSTLDDKDYAEQVEGQAVEAGGRAFFAFNAIENVKGGPLTKYSPDYLIYVGSDFNVDPMCWVLCHIRQGKLIVFDELYMNDTNTRLALDELLRRYGNHKAGFVFIGDATSRARKTVGTAASPSDYALIKQDTRFGDKVSVQYPSTNPRVKDRLAACNALLCTRNETRRLFINPRCEHLINDLMSRDLDDHGQPVDANKWGGHITDALGYIVHKQFPISAFQETEGADGGINFQVVS